MLDLAGLVQQVLFSARLIETRRLISYVAVHADPQLSSRSGGFDKLAGTAVTVLPENWIVSS